MRDSGMLADPRHRRESRLVVASLVASLGLHAAAVGLFFPVTTGSIEPPAPINVSLRVAPEAPAGPPRDSTTLDRSVPPAPDVPSEKEIVPSDRLTATAQPKAARVAVPARLPLPLRPEKVAAATVPKSLPAAHSRPPAKPLPTADPIPPDHLQRGESRYTPPVLAVAMEPARKVIAPTTPPEFRADYLSNPPPAYPRRARRDGIEGTVTLRVLVTASGAPGEVTIETSSGSESLDRAALNAVRAWQFVPARRAEEAIDAWIRVPVVFRLESG